MGLCFLWNIKFFHRHQTPRTANETEKNIFLLQRESLEEALRQLYVLDALDIDGKITEIGKQMAALPLDPSLSRTLLAARTLGCLPDALTIAGMLSSEATFSGHRFAASALHCGILHLCRGPVPCFSRMNNLRDL